MLISDANTYAKNTIYIEINYEVGEFVHNRSTLTTEELSCNESLKTEQLFHYIYISLQSIIMK